MRDGTRFVVAALRHVLKDVLHRIAMLQVTRIRTRRIGGGILFLALLTFVSVQKKNELFLNELFALNVDRRIRRAVVARRSVSLARRRWWWRKDSGNGLSSVRLRWIRIDGMREVIR